MLKKKALTSIMTACEASHCFAVFAVAVLSLSDVLKNSVKKCARLFPSSIAGLVVLTVPD